MMDDMHDFWLGSDELDMMPRSARSRFNRAIDRRIALVEVGRNICFGKGGGSAPSPDPNIGVAAMKNAEVGEQWLGFAKEQFEVGNERQQELDALTKSIVDQQMATQDETNAWAREDRARTKSVFQPLQDEFIKEAKDYASEARQAEAAAEAGADVRKAFDTQGQINTRNMARMGINPNSGRFQEQTRLNDVAAATASAGAQNTARRQIRDKGLVLKADAINMGAGLPSSTAAAYGIGLNAGNSASGNTVSAEQNWRSNVGIMGQGFGGAMQGYNNQGNILSNLYGNQVQAWQAQQQANATSAAGIGQILGTGIGSYAALRPA